MSASRSMPVSTPMAARQWTRSSVQTLPEAPGAKGQPPSPPMEASKWVTPISIANRMFGMAMARVSWVWIVHSTPGKRGHQVLEHARDLRGVGHAGGVGEADARGAEVHEPLDDRLELRHRHVALERAAERAGDAGSTRACRRGAATSATVASSLASDSAMVMFTLARLWLSLAETTVWMSSTPASTARTAPLSLGTSAE